MAAGATGLTGLVAVAAAAALVPVVVGAGAAMLLPDPGTRGGGGWSTWLLVALAAALAVVVGWGASLAAKILAVLLGVRRRSVLRTITAVVGLGALAGLLHVLVFEVPTAALFAAVVATALAMVLEPLADRALAAAPEVDRTH